MGKEVLSLLKTKQEYLESLKQLKPKIYINGEEVDHPLKHPSLLGGLKMVERTYELPHDPQYRDLLIFHSPLINEKVSLWTSTIHSKDDLRKLAKAIKTIVNKHLCMMCLSLAFNCLWATTYDIDAKKGTNYHENFKNILKYMQKNDLRFSLAIMDPKGDRMLKPSQQEDPDLYLRIVDKNEKGIVVRGAKIHHTLAPLTHYMFVAPCRVMTQDESRYAVSFTIPTDTEGITYISSVPRTPQEIGVYENPIFQKINPTEYLTIFDDVLIPWENVLMCEEWEFTVNHLQAFRPFVRFCKNTCTSARIDVLIGTVALLAECNSIEKTSHVREKLVEMMVYSEMGYGSSLGSIENAKTHPSGVIFPDISKASSSLYLLRQMFPKFIAYLHDIGGGIIVTGPGEKDYKNPKTGKFIEKYLKGKKGIPAEQRLKTIFLARNLAASNLTGYLFGSVLCGGGTPETNKLDVIENYNLEEKKKIVKEFVDIKTS